MFKEQVTASLCRSEAKKLEDRFEELLDLRSEKIHLRQTQGSASVGSWLFYAPPGKAFELQLNTKEMTSTILRIPCRTSGHIGLIQMQFESDDSSAVPLRRTLDVFGPGFVRYSRNAEEGMMYGNIVMRLEKCERNANPIMSLIAGSPWLDGPYMPGYPRSIVECDSTQNAILAYFREEELPGTKLKHKDFAVTVVEVIDR